MTWTPHRSRMDDVQAPLVPIIGDLIRRTPGTISLGQGVAHYGPPAAAIEAARAALEDPSINEYQAVEGISSLRSALAAKLAADNGIEVGDAIRLMVTAGANLAFMHAVMAVTGPGDEIVLPVPFYFNHEMAIQMAGCRVIPVPTDDRYQPRVEAIRAALTPRTRAVVTISPNNPTGAVYGEDTLRAIGALCAERGLYHVSDEVYEYFTYDGARHVSPASFPGAGRHTISLFSLSKAYGFAGWRIGYMTYPGHLASAMLKSQDTLLVCPPVITQAAAAAAVAVGRSYSAPYVAELGEVRRLVLDALATLGPLVTVPRPAGAFYCFMRVNRDVDPMALAERLIREHRVAVMPGTAFGMGDGCYFRIAYGALQKATVAEGIGRLVDGVRALAP